MKKMRFFMLGMLCMPLTMAVTQISYSQTIVTVVDDLSWTSPTSSTTSSGTIDACGETVNVTLTSTGLPHILDGSGSGAYLPTNRYAGGNVTVTLNFSPAVNNLSLLLNDFDEFGTGDVGDDGSPSEFGSGFIPAINTITPVVGSPTFVGTGTPGSWTGVDPNGAVDTKGYVGWTGMTSSVTFTYNRPDASNGGGWGLIIDEIRFDCIEPLSCLCSDENQFIVNGRIGANGSTSSTIQLSSGGMEVSKINISIPYWRSLVNSSCIDCNAPGILNSGKIINLPTIAGITPSFTGPSGYSNEIVYEFPTPTVVEENISLNMQFPPVVLLSCCQNKVDYCVKIEMIDSECRVCETTLCTSREGKKGTEVKSLETKNVSRNVDIQGSPKENKIRLTPNPVTDLMMVNLPDDTGNIQIFHVDGKIIETIDVSQQTLNVNTGHLTPGHYLLKYSNNNYQETLKFIKE